MGSIRSIKQNMVLIVASIIFSLVLLEIGLRIGGAIYLFVQEQNNRKGLGGSGTYRILCLGESSTALGGEDSFPKQLEKILRAKRPDLNVRAINKGIPGITTSYILTKLDGYLYQYNPDMVVVMMGINDFADDRAEFQDNFGVRLKTALTEMRVYKLCRLIYLSLSNRVNKGKEQNLSRDEEFVYRRILEDIAEGYGPYFETGWGYIAEGKFVEAESLFRKAVTDFPDDPSAYVNLGLCLAFAGRLGDAETVMREGLNKIPNNSDLYITLGQIYIVHQRWKEAIDVLVQAKTLDKDNNDIDMALGFAYLKQGDVSSAEILYKNSAGRYGTHDSYKALKLFYEMQHNRPLADEYLIKSKEAKMGAFNPVTKHNYNVLKEKVLNSRIKLVSVQYPRREVSLLRKLLGNDTRVIYVDNEDVFNAAVAGLGYDAVFIDNFAGDFGHCTPEGNRLLAQNIAEAILKGF